MKTNILYIAALVIAGALSSCQKDAAEPDLASAGSMKAIPEANNMIVHYQVSVLQSISAPVCGTYLVEIVNSAGQPVDAPKTFKRNQTLYFFSEQVTTPTGVRIARIVPDLSTDGSVCANILSTHPEAENLVFKDGMAYFFYLYPTYKQTQLPQ